ncbi:Hint domain-containing protein [Sagittula sp. S175]|uniref:Hint domain-containing protein n=1 Tax=Sagittula sp. S175 TaxID=3415129 RepID=UPI003C7AF4B7
MDVPLQYQILTLSLIPDTLLSADYNLFLNGLSAVQPAALLSDDTGILYVGEQVTMGSRTVEILGSGTAQPGVQILSLVVPLGTAVDVVYMRDVDTGELILSYPEGPPNLLSAVALVLTIEPEGYNLNTNAPVCFCKGTRLATATGPVRVEKLRPGDRLLDWSGTPVTVLACISTHYPAPPADWRPIVIDPDAFGPGFPERRLRISPQHRLCMPGIDPVSLPILGPAKGFTSLPRIRQRGNGQPVTYYHIVTERHALLCSEGLPSESLLLARNTLRLLQPETRFKLLKALRLTEDSYTSHPAATPCGTLLSMRDTRKLAEAWSVQNRLTPQPAWPARPGPRLRLVA